MTGDFKLADVAKATAAGGFIMSFESDNDDGTDSGSGDNAAALRLDRPLSSLVTVAAVAVAVAVAG